MGTSSKKARTPREHQHDVVTSDEGRGRHNHKPAAAVGGAAGEPMQRRLRKQHQQQHTQQGNEQRRRQYNTSRGILCEERHVDVRVRSEGMT
jgi:hypothetical protein